MSKQPRTMQILSVLAQMEYATADMLCAHIQCTRAEVVKTLANMRRRHVISTQGRQHQITVKGRGELLAGPPQRSVIHAPFKVPNARAQSEYLLAKASKMNVSHENSAMRRPTWVPPAWTPARPSANDHKQYASRGVR